MIKNILFDRIEKEINRKNVVLFMKGTAAFPRCSSSAAIVQILSRLCVPFRDIDVSGDSELRRGLKDYANWPTLPQLYIRGTFIGGVDIVREIEETGELKELLKST